MAKKDPQWEPLLVQIDRDKRLSNGLAGFANFCTLTGLPPNAVNDETVQAFLLWLETRTLEPKPRDRVRRVPNIWDEARKRVSGWPDIALSRLSFRKPQEHLDWS